MQNLKEEIIKVKKDYLDKVLNVSKEYKYVVVYGAGKVAISLYNLLDKKGIKILAFCVSEKSINKKEEHGVPVLQVDEMNFEQKDTLVVLGINEKWKREVLDLLDRYGYMDYIDVPKYVNYFDYRTFAKFTRPVMEITTKIGCNVNCRYCPQKSLITNYYSHNGMDKTFLTFEVFKECIDKTPEELIVIFAGYSEPFLNKDCIDMIEYADSLGRDICLFTTLMGVDKKSFERLIKIPFYEVVLHVPDRDGYAEIPLTDEYFEVLDLFVNHTKEDGAPFVDRANSQSIPHKEVLKHTANKIRIFSDISDRGGNLTEEDVYKDIHIEGELSCKQSQNLNWNVLLPNGDVVLCAVDYALKHRIGNLMISTYEDIIKSKELRRIKNNMSERKGDILCRYCDCATKRF